MSTNYATHKHEWVKRWLEELKRLHLTPTSAAWLGKAERFFRGIPHNRTRCGVFQGIEQLIMAIENYIDVYNRKPKPFIWTAKSTDIHEKVSCAKIALKNGLSA